MPHNSALIAALALFLTVHLNSTEPLTGVFGENSMQRVLDYEAWLGRKVDVILCTVDFQKWENYRYANWLSQTVYGQRGGRRLVYDVPIIIQDASYAEAKTGAYDGHWKCLAGSILENNPGEHEIVIRPSHEMNGEWFAWGVGGAKQAQIPDFIASWQRFHGVFAGFRAGSGSLLLFDNRRCQRSAPDVAGDEYVDIVGQDVYWKPKVMGGEGWETNDPKEAWEKRVSPSGYNEWNLGGMLAFAKAHGKPFQIDEWGVWDPMRLCLWRRWRLFEDERGAFANVLEF